MEQKDERGKMKAIRVHTIGGPEVLQYEEIAKPEPGTGEARVKIEASGVNYIDTYQRSGLYKVPAPFTLGQEAAGVVDAVGAGVTEVKVGDRVAYASVMGAYADYAIVPALRLVAVPQGISAQQAAAVMLQGMTAHYLACDTFPLKPGDTALVHAAAGGVGLLLVQIAKLRGARVIGTVSTEDKARLAKQVGADEVILYTQQDFEAEVKRLTDGKGVNVVYDSVGKTTFDQSLNCIKPRGYMVLFGASSGPVPPLDPQVLNAKGSLFLTRPLLAHYTADRVELTKRASALFEWMNAGKLSVHVDRTFPLANAADAHRALHSRATKGKILLIP
jgi:NADPH2:quinone reductase